MDHAIPDKVHWFSIVNSILIVFFLAFMVAMILLRSLNRDITKYIISKDQITRSDLHRVVLHIIKSQVFAHIASS